MKPIESMDRLDYIDQISNNLDQAEGILSSLEISLSTIDQCHTKLPFAVSAAMQCIENSRGLFNRFAREEEVEELEEMEC